MCLLILLVLWVCAIWMQVDLKWVWLSTSLWVSWPEHGDEYVSFLLFIPILWENKYNIFVEYLELKREREKWGSTLFFWDSVKWSVVLQLHFYNNCIVVLGHLHKHHHHFTYKAILLYFYWMYVSLQAISSSCLLIPILEKCTHSRQTFLIYNISCLILWTELYNKNNNGKSWWRSWTVWLDL